ncbi:hypothetical protein IAQ61_011972 [Plenodomus lingam]|uniref:uncharacterized protein n=1 Tax=Leptosphaeria maculans TaxID=5022 RepID=UPI00332FA27D|nr:hypothetical protein IAQ61_011972 [Plenodomus lingam]
MYRRYVYEAFVHWVQKGFHKLHLPSVRAVDRSENEVVSVTAETGDWRLETGDWRLDFQSSLASPSPTPFEGEQRAKLGLVEFASGRLMEKIIIRHENPSAAHVHRV